MVLVINTTDDYKLSEAVEGLLNQTTTDFEVINTGLSHLMIFHQSGSPVIMSFFYYFE